MTAVRRVMVMAGLGLMGMRAWADANSCGATGVGGTSERFSDDGDAGTTECETSTAWTDGGGRVWYNDADADGDPDDATVCCCASTDGCASPSASVTGFTHNASYGTATNASFPDWDCNDNDATVYAGAPEICDGQYNDCDNPTVPTNETDGDDDCHVSCSAIDTGGWDATLSTACASSGMDVGDCDTADPTVYAGAAELCDGQYNNCSDTGYSSSGAPTNETDGDDDCHVTCTAIDAGGWDATLSTACTSSGMDVGDCDTADPTVYAGATELCDGQYNDCSDTNYSSSGAPADETDADDDCYVSCAAIDGGGWDATLSANCSGGMDVGDCDTGDGTVYPGATELCDGQINDCDTTTLPTNETDGDGDGYVACDLDTGGWDGSLSAGHSSMGGGDCDTADSGVSPGATETWYDGTNSSCNSGSDYDADSDGYEAEYYNTDTATGADCFEGTYKDTDTDSANVGAAAINPGATETWYDDTDQDCDDASDYDADGDGLDSADYGGTDCNDNDPAIGATASDWYPDADGDGYGDEDASATNQCSAPTGYVADHTDCDDTKAAVNPDPTTEEDCSTSYDDDCDGNINQVDAIGCITYYDDTDGDNYGDPSDSACYCSAYVPYTTTDNTDCDPSDAAVYPGRQEDCSTSYDDNCDASGETNELNALNCNTYYKDHDGDGYGTSTDSACYCATTGEYTSTLSTDCDDDDSAIVPGATEVCDSVDNDCDGDIDDDDSSLDTSTATSWYYDDDGDGYGDATDVDVKCDQPANRVADSTDCDDSDADINPGMTEICDDDNADENCNGSADDSDPGVDTSTYIDYYVDVDNDGYGKEGGTATTQCDAPASSYSYVADDTDCNDYDSSINPGADEICDSADEDEDCDGFADDDDSSTTGQYQWYEDSDGDGYGDSSGSPIASCEQITGRVDNNQDCDDNDNTSSISTTSWYPDLDNDGYGDMTATATSGCTSGAGGTGWSTTNDDCDDDSSDDDSVSVAADIYPGATEICDGIDNDCDELIDDADTGLDTSTADTWYYDGDSDGYGTPSTSTVACDQPSDYVDNDEDCNDSKLSINPDKDEYCDGIDNDCNGTVDDTYSLDASTWYADTDEDGYGDPAVTTPACSQPSGYVSDDTDCDDTVDTTYPSAPETCDGVDNDCNDTIDDDSASDATTWYADDDNDTFGDAADSQQSCTQPTGYVLDDTDCDDTDGTINTSVSEIWYDGVDQDCDEASDYDADSDGFLSDTYGGTDCDDSDAAINPDAVEIWYNSVDEDCSGTSGYDSDGDGQDSVDFAGGTDCYDNDADLQADADALEIELTFTAADAYYGAVETWYDGLDQDCMGDSDYDADQDGYDSVAYGGDDCVDSTADYEALLVDCSGGDPGMSAADINPGAADECEDSVDCQIDADCDGNPNTADGDYLVNTSGATYYKDDDGDTHGSPDKEYNLCQPESGFTTSFGDCDDGNAEIHPGADEICNNLDDDCDGVVDEAGSLSDESGCIDLYADQDLDGYGDTENSACMCFDGVSDDCPEGYEYDPISQLCYTNQSGDCYDYDASIHPLADGEQLVEVIDGHDNDCNEQVPIIELDCDDDGALAMMPIPTETNSVVAVAADVGLADCRGPDLEADPDCCKRFECPDMSVCDDLEIPEFLRCWTEFDLRLACDSVTGLITVPITADGIKDRYNGGRRTYENVETDKPCTGAMDCDDQCGQRCPNLSESCDGLDNDCSDGTQFAADSDRNGIPDSMETDLVVPGYVNESELDLDGDGFLGCNTGDLLGAYQTRLTYSSCSINENLADCNNQCSLASPVTEDERCNGFLDICDGDGEGEDKDRDSFESCGAWGPESSDLVDEDIWVLVYYEPKQGWDYTVEDTGGSDTGAVDTAADDTSTGDTSAGDTAVGDTSTGDTSTSDTSIGDTSIGDTSAGDTATRGGGYPWSSAREGRKVQQLVPLMLPRPNAVQCDAVLASQLSAVLGEQALVDAVETGSSEAMLDKCIRAQACKAQAEGAAEGQWPEDCEDVPEGQCTVVKLTLNSEADDGIYDDDLAWWLDADEEQFGKCSDHPEQLITRSVWSQERILQARSLVVEWECFRLFGTYGCGDLTTPPGWEAPYGELAAPGGHFSNPDPDIYLSEDMRWWKELLRYQATPMLTDLVAGCWGDPDPGTKQLSEVISANTGGDCTDSSVEANRGHAEGPDDLLGIYLGAPADCSTCLDGLDNNCNGMSDCAEPACARCFVGQGIGCGGGSESPCAQYGCAAYGGSRDRRSSPLGVALFSVFLVVLGSYRRRDQ